MSMNGAWGWRWGLCGVLLWGGVALCDAAPIPEQFKIGGYAIGCQAWTFNRFSAYEAVEKTAAAGGKVIEFYPGQKLSPTQPEAKLDHNVSDDVLAKLKAHLTKHGVRAANYGVVHGNDETEWRKIFEFAKKLELYAVTTEDVDKLDLLERLAREFDVYVAIHNHPRRPTNPNYKVWDPAYVLALVKDRDRRIGASADTGHWATSNVRPMEGIRLLQGRIISVHLKERTAVGRETHDTIFGTGVCEIGGILDELKRQGFQGNISIEYEHNWENSVPDVAQCIGFVRGYTARR